MAPTTAALAGILLLGLALFQLVLALGAPLGAYAWGGRHHGRLPTRLRLASLAAIPVLALLAAVILARGAWLGDAFADVAGWSIWFVAAYFAVNTLGNFVSRSRGERLVMAPLSLALTVLTVLTAVG